MSLKHISKKTGTEKPPGRAALISCSAMQVFAQGRDWGERFYEFVDLTAASPGFITSLLAQVVCYHQ